MPVVSGEQAEDAMTTHNAVHEWSDDWRSPEVHARVDALCEAVVMFARTRDVRVSSDLAQRSLALGNKAGHCGGERNRATKRWESINVHEQYEGQHFSDVQGSSSRGGGSDEKEGRKNGA